MYIYIYIGTFVQIQSEMKIPTLFYSNAEHFSDLNEKS